MKKEDVIISARKMIGAFLKEIREDKSIRIQRLRDEGLHFDVVKSIEEGTKAYTIDSLLNYCQVVGINPVFIPAAESADQVERLNAMIEKIKRLSTQNSTGDQATDQ